MVNLNFASLLYSDALQGNVRFNIDDPVWEEARQLRAREEIFEASLTEEQKKEYGDLIADHDHAREKGAFIIGLESAIEFLGLGDHAASYGQKNVGVGTVTTNNGAIGNFYGPVTIINGSKNQPAGNEAELLQAFATLDTLDQAKVFVFIDELTAGKSE